ncbi:MAG: GHMP family kinase ATP-binding protein, partial [Candidatus Helarchaeota archaeon]
MEDAPVSRSVAEQFLSLINENITIILKHKIKLPIGSGFGCSGAGALSASLALNKEFELNLKKEKCGQIAHIAEVSNRTGLGDVIGSFFRGFEIRVKPGAPGIGKVRNILISKDVVVVCATKGVLPTKKVLSNSNLRKN